MKPTAALGRGAAFSGKRVAAWKVGITDEIGNGVVIGGAPPVVGAETLSVFGLEAASGLVFAASFFGASVFVVPEVFVPEVAAGEAFVVGVFFFEDFDCAEASATTINPMSAATSVVFIRVLREQRD